MSHRNIAFALALIGALCGLVCSTATASTLLSGYGGPGGGEQVILGSQLLNTPSPPAGAQSAASSSPLESSAPAPGADVPSPVSETNQAEGSTQARRPAAKRAERSPRTARSRFTSPPGEPATSAQVSYDLRSGLSDGQLALIALVAACLLALALGTRSLSRLQR